MNHHFKDEQDFSLKLYDVFAENFHFKWGNYNALSGKEYGITPEKESLVVHLCLLGSCTTIGNEKLSVDQNRFIIFKEKAVPYFYKMGTTKDHQGSFFELSLPNHYLDELFTEEDIWSSSFHLKNQHEQVFQNRISADLITLVNQLRSNPYCNHSKLLFWEAKLIELLLSLSGKIDQSKRSSLKPYEKECIYGIKDLLHEKYSENLTIGSLSKLAGINQTTLKRGFKELFGMTLFGYLTDVRMDKAKEMLLDGNYTISDVAEIAGYSYPQHFTTAFKRKLGFSPYELKK